MKRRVVVTGLGAVTPIGNRVDEMWSSIRAGKSGLGPITLFDTTDFKVKIAAEVAIKYGDFIQSIINFVLIAFVIFMVLKAYNRMRAPAPDAAPAEEVLLLREIRDNLKR